MKGEGRMTRRTLFVLVMGLLAVSVGVGMALDPTQRQDTRSAQMGQEIAEIMAGWVELGVKGQALQAIHDRLIAITNEVPALPEGAVGERMKKGVGATNGLSVGEALINRRLQRERDAMERAKKAQRSQWTPSPKEQDRWLKEE